MKWRNRQGSPEDPWISLTDYEDTSTGIGITGWGGFSIASIGGDGIDIGNSDMLYGENSVDDHTDSVVAHDGANVYIRYKWSETIDGGGWQFVRRVKAGLTWHPATDNLTGHESYGTFGHERSDTTFSVGFANIRFNQFLFATGMECTVKSRI